MQKNFLAVVLLLFTIIFNGQTLIKGQLFNEFGDIAWAEISLNRKSTKKIDNNGLIELESFKRGLNEITIEYFGHFTTKILFDSNEDIVDLGKIYLISGQFWLNGSKYGILNSKYDSGKTKYKIEIKN